MQSVFNPIISYLNLIRWRCNGLLSPAARYSESKDADVSWSLQGNVWLHRENLETWWILPWLVCWIDSSCCSECCWKLGAVRRWIWLEYKTRLIKWSTTSDDNLVKWRDLLSSRISENVTLNFASRRVSLIIAHNFIQTHTFVQNFGACCCWHLLKRQMVLGTTKAMVNVLISWRKLIT